ncbi:MAG: TIM barrel protein [Proteobacteria bacterium]|nr:TIM barrel protein [Pseudomonadota bacterium]
MIGLSTSWLTQRTNMTGRKVIQEIVTLGFSEIELDYRITDTAFREMVPLILREELKIISIHNYFPCPNGTPTSWGGGDLFLLSSPDKDERSRAVEMTLRTIESAQDLGAPAVVLHLGRVEMKTEYDRLHTLSRDNMLDSPEGRRFVERKLEERRQHRGPYVDALLRSLDRLNKEGEKRGVLLGIENRYHYHEIPDFEEVGLILDSYSGGSLRYWHDVGHAHVQEKLGFMEPGTLIQTYSPMLLGVHIHDANGTDDHWAPGSGEIDFWALKKDLEPAQLKILEVHGKSTRNQLLTGMALLERIGLS